MTAVLARNLGGATMAHRDSEIEALIASARRLSRAVSRLQFAPPVACVYNPLAYAWNGYEAYLRAYGAPPKQVMFMGMNPGPFGMVQTGVPFGEVEYVRNWLQIQAPIGIPACQHPRRPIMGFDCPRSEVSGRRLWGLFARRFGSARTFFRQHYVFGYCPLAFLEKTGRNHTPDKLPAQERDELFAACDRHVRDSVALLRPDWLIAIGDFAFRRAQAVFAGDVPRLGRILHPSPASPAANRNWEQTVTRQLEELGVWQRTSRLRHG